MPTLTIFEGMKFEMYVHDHPPPHIKVTCGDYSCCINIKTLEMTKGFIPTAKFARAQEWTKKYRNKLWEMWRLKSPDASKLAPLEPQVVKKRRT